MEQITLDWAPERRYFSVGELMESMRLMLTAEFTDIWVSGEISGAKLAASGHYYFTLKDQAAQLRCVCYRMTARYLKFKPQDGVEVLARGRVDVYDARGEVQFVAEVLEPQGHGALQFAFEQLKRKLAMEGLFDASRKRPLPALPERIGIVTSPQGAVIRDILHVLERRCPGRHVRIFPTPVQGEGAASQIAAGVEHFSRSGWAEVVIVARGGGSLEDLWAFNEEPVARAISACSVPVISAVGHETDFTIADFVADLRAPTPSAAAEIVTATRASLIERLRGAESKIRQAMRLELVLASRRLHRMSIDEARLRHAVGRRMQRVDECEYRLRDCVRSAIERRIRRVNALHAAIAQRDVRLQLAGVRRRLDAADSRLQQAIQRRLGRAREAFAPVQAHLVQLSPLRVLERGYAIVEHGGKIVKSPADAPAKSTIRVRVTDGAFSARVLRSETPPDRQP